MRLFVEFMGIVGLWFGWILIAYLAVVAWAIAVFLVATVIQMFRRG